MDSSQSAFVENGCQMDIRLSEGLLHLLCKGAVALDCGNHAAGLVHNFVRPG